ncbi:MAG: hypothetical protein GDA55_06245 [Cellvibrionales bacterium]|nr:hypothetical protein [Cellvibrionales bacterium]
MKSTKENLEKHAIKPITSWLIDAAKRRTNLTYGEAKQRLLDEIGFERIGGAYRLGGCCDMLMKKIHASYPDAPLLNTLMVSKKNPYPGFGIRYFMAEKFNDNRFANEDFCKTNKKLWEQKVDDDIGEVYAYQNWGTVFEEVFGEKLQSPPPPQGTEKDGETFRRSGEGPNHKKLRLWVQDNPAKIDPAFTEFRAETEFVLESADRVDVVFFGPEKTVVVEVKSIDSNDADIRRGVFQCIKYRAVMEAMTEMDARRTKPKIKAILVTQVPLPKDLKPIARKNCIRHIQAPIL